MFKSLAKLLGGSDEAVVKKLQPDIDEINALEPEFQAILSDIKKDMAAQLERARAMEANGELARIPDDQKYQ